MIILDEYFWILEIPDKDNIVLAIKKKRQREGEVAGCLDLMVIFYIRCLYIWQTFLYYHVFFLLFINVSAAFIYWFSFLFLFILKCQKPKQITLSAWTSQAATE